MSGDDLIQVLAIGAGGLGGFAAFAISWIYCVQEYGFLVGVSLGWFPSMIVAGLTFLLIRYLWWLLILIGVFALSK